MLGGEDVVLPYLSLTSCRSCDTEHSQASILVETVSRFSFTVIQSVPSHDSLPSGSLYYTLVLTLRSTGPWENLPKTWGDSQPISTWKHVDTQNVWTRILKERILTDERCGVLRWNGEILWTPPVSQTSFWLSRFSWCSLKTTVQEGFEEDGFIREKKMTYTWRVYIPTESQVYNIIFLWAESYVRKPNIRTRHRKTGRLDI